MKDKLLISIDNCRIESNEKTIVPNLSWTMKSGEVWLVIGPNGGGKADFVNALAGKMSFVIQQPMIWPLPFKRKR